jgi:hypothetical protein
MHGHINIKSEGYQHKYLVQIKMAFFDFPQQVAS